MNHSPPGSFVHEFSQEGYWSGLSFPPPGGLDPGMQLTSPALQVDSLSLSHWGSPYKQSVATNLSAMHKFICQVIVHSIFIPCYI